MCLSVQGKVVDVSDDSKFAVVDFGGVRRDVNVELVSVVRGNNVLVHAGFAIKIISEEDFLSNGKLILELSSG